MKIRAILFEFIGNRQTDALQGLCFICTDLSSFKYILLLKSDY